MVKSIRIATTAVGDVYEVQQLNFTTNTAACWGELVRFKATVDRRTGKAVSVQRTHVQGSKSFALTAVQITTITPDVAFFEKLLKQSERNGTPRPITLGQALGPCPPELAELVRKAVQS